MERILTIVKPIQPIAIRPAAEIITIKAAPAMIVKASTAIVVEPRRHEAIKIKPALAVTVQPPERGAWDERGWVRTGGGGRETYEGFYFAGNRKFRGRIEVHGLRGHRIRAYIYDPPREVKHHPHGACFQLVGENWFHLHWSRPARNVDDAILYMERVLDESLNG